MKYFFGIVIARNSSGIYLCPRKYALQILYETGLSGAKLAFSPLKPNYNLAKDIGDFFLCLIIIAFLLVN